MLILHASNHLENLSQQFAELVSQPLNSVFASEQVVVQNPAMGQWLSLQMAQQLGISANYQYFSPANYMWSLLRKVIDDVPTDDPSQPATLRWRLFSLFLTDAKNYPELSHYLTHESAAWELADALAPVLDQYLFYRPEWINEWEAGNFATNDWQARLWQTLIMDDAGETRQMSHWLDLQQRFIQHFSQKHQTQYVGKFPQRVSFFSVSALSTGYIRLLGELSSKIDVHLFIVNPCRYYWGEIESRKMPSNPASNPLLNSLGQQGREFIDQFYDLGAKIKENWGAPQQDTVLHCLQADVLTQQQSKTSPQERQSIQIHACHTPMREIEVLHDQILSALEQSNDLNPADIVVMAPAIEPYAPYIDAVFSTAEQALPFSITDRSVAKDKPEVEVFLKLLDLPEHRFNVEAVFELLEYPQIYERFNLDQKQVLQCRNWAEATNIRWGVDAKMRASSGLPETYEHSWKYGLDRMLLGYMMPSEQLFDDSLLLPFNQIEGNDAQVLASFKLFTDTIFQLANWSLSCLDAGIWVETLRQLITAIFTEETDDSALFKALDTLNQQQQLAEFSQPIAFNIIKKILQGLLATTQDERFMSRGITFCALTPMRSVPFKMIALLGMNDGDFPRQDSHHSFDKMAKNTKRGDRSRRDEDRYLFLESLLAARQSIYISYIGQSVQDNGSLPPSVIVSELLDYLTKMTGQAQQQWICKHPLQAFSSRYYSDDKNNELFSYVKEYIVLHHQKPIKKETKPAFITKKLAEPDEEFKQIDLEQLIQFYKSPARAFLKHGFAIQLFNDENLLPIREPFALESFIDTQVRQQISLADKTKPKDNELNLCRAKGLLPHGDIGGKVFDQQAEIVDRFYQQYPQLLDLTPQQQAFRLPLGEFTLSGKLSDLSEIGCVKHHLGTYYAGDLLAIWLHHLVLNSVDLTHSTKAETQVYQPDDAFTLGPINDAKDLLSQLVQGYWRGLQQPLYFFPKPAYKMYEKSPEANLSVAESAWNNTFFGSESDKFENQLLFAEKDISELFNQEFLNFAEIIFGRMATTRFDNEARKVL
jgi:exodeoxyribonuclease V gamma subunit